MPPGRRVDRLAAVTAKRAMPSSAPGSSSAVLLEAVRQGRPGLEILPTLLSNRR